MCVYDTEINSPQNENGRFSLFLHKAIVFHYIYIYVFVKMLLSKVTCIVFMVCILSVNLFRGEQAKSLSVIVV